MFRPDRRLDGERRIVAMNARLFDDFNADDAPAGVVDGKNRGRDKS